jgi:energy-coupling factor transporter ATP-binding protein EcfA2
MKSYLLVGRTGVGKSSFINSAFGIDVPTDPYEACTKVVEYYHSNTTYGKVRFFDSPGLAELDGCRDQTYLNLAKARITNVDLEAMIYVSPLNETRFREEEQESLRQITCTLGRAIWASSWLVLTFAASVLPDRREDVARHRHDSIMSFVRDLTTGYHDRKRFRGFRQVLLVDNVVPKWSVRSRPLDDFFDDRAWRSDDG